MPTSRPAAVRARSRRSIARSTARMTGTGWTGSSFDESVPYPVTCDQVPYHAELNRYVKAKGGAALTVINHGQILPECYADVADIQMNAETTYESYVKEWRPLGLGGPPPGKEVLAHGARCRQP